jgi:hypothetical protein
MVSFIFWDLFPSSESTIPLRLADWCRSLQPSRFHHNAKDEEKWQSSYILQTKLTVQNLLDLRREPALTIAYYNVEAIVKKKWNDYSLRRPCLQVCNGGVWGTRPRHGHSRESGNPFSRQ